MKNEKYLVTTWINGRARRHFWDTSEALALDYPDNWFLESSNKGVRVRGIGKPLAFFPKAEILRTGTVLDLPDQTNPGLRVRLSIKKIKPIRPAYLPSLAKNGDEAESQLFISFGYRNSIARFQRVHRAYVAVLDRKKAFGLGRTKTGYRMKSFMDDLTLWIADDHVVTLKKGARVELTEEELSQAVVFAKRPWWRVNRVAVVDIPKMTESEKVTQAQDDNRWFNRLVQGVVLSFALLVLLVMLIPKPVPVELKPVQITQSTLLDLKKPKVVMKKHEVAPPVVAAAPAPPRPAAHPPARHAPPVKVAKALPPPRAKTIAPPPKALPPPQVSQAVIARNQLAKSLGFLSAAPKSVASAPVSHVNSKYQVSSGSNSQLKKSDSLLASMAAPSAPEGSINTKGARTMDSNVQLSGPRGKSLNEVQGRVSMKSLYASGESADFGSSVGGKSLSVSGEGKISESLIEKALARSLAKFQYCYEKALLSDSSLSGNVQMQWTISPGGGASDVKVLKSQLNNATLHQCISHELVRIQFPSPSGGSVAVKYPFSFNSSSL